MTSQFDFNNDGDCFLAGKDFCLSDDSSTSMTLTFLDLLAQDDNALSLLYPEFAISEDEAMRLQKEKQEKPSIMPYVAINDLNHLDDESTVDEIKPRPTIEIGIMGDF